MTPGKAQGMENINGLRVRRGGRYYFLYRPRNPTGQAPSGFTTIYIIYTPVIPARKVANSLRVITLKRFIFLSFLGIRPVFQFGS